MGLSFPIRNREALFAHFTLAKSRAPYLGQQDRALSVLGTNADCFLNLQVEPKRLRAQDGEWGA